MAGSGREREDLSDVIKKLPQRWFVMRSLKRAPRVALLQSRTTLSWMRGPMTREDIRRLVGTW